MFVDVKICLQGPLHVDQLFELVTNHFNINLWSTLFKTPQDLSTFLKIYSHLFHVQANIVTLVPHKPYAPTAAATTTTTAARSNNCNNSIAPQRELHNNQHSNGQDQESPKNSMSVSPPPASTPPKSESPR